MPTPPASEHARIEALIHEAAHLALWLARQMHGLLAPFAGKRLAGPFMRALLRDYLLPAEAALRRAVHLMAADMPPPQTTPRPAKAPPARAPGAGSAIRTPAFRLTESEPRPQAEHRPHPAPHPAPSAPRDTARIEARLRRRLAAFEAALANPRRAARRLSRRLKKRTSARPLLAFAHIPGYHAAPIAAPGRLALDRANAQLRALYTADTS